MATNDAGSGPPGDAAGLGKGEVFDLLSNHRRRYTLHYCKRAEEPVTTGDLAETVAAWELDKAQDAISSDERKRVYTSLQQTHLPTLADAGMITYEDHEVRLTDQARELEIYLDIVPEGSIPWGPYYLGLSALGFGVLAGLAADVVPTGTIPVLGWAALILGVVAASAAVHAFTGRRHRLGEADRPP